MTNTSCTLTPTPCHAVVASVPILSATGRAHPQPGQQTRPWLSSGFARKQPSQHQLSSALGTGNPAACCFFFSHGHLPAKAPHMPCLRAFQLASRPASSSASDNRRGYRGACRRRLRRPGLRRPFHQNKREPAAAAAAAAAVAQERPQVPGVRVSVPSRGCYAARCQCDAPGLAGGDPIGEPWGRTVTAADGTTW